jgi:hypothetical protein
MNGIVNIACNQLFPYINALMAMNIANAIFVFVLFILAYFLTTRLQFYELLEGNFDNFGAEQLDSKSDALDSSNNRNVELLETGRSNN